MATHQSDDVPNDPPPSYSQATGSSAGGSSSSRPQRNSHLTTQNNHLAVPGSSSGLQDADRHSIIDQARPLPKGWVRCYDDKVHHQFFVDTTKTPPRSIWVHPYDDDEYLMSLPSGERERIQQDTIDRAGSANSRAHAIHCESDDDEARHHATASGGGGGSSNASGSAQKPADLPPRPDGNNKEKQSLGRKLKDKITGMTHEEREAERKQRAEAERRAYEQHMRFRDAMGRAVQTGEPQLLGKDQNGKDVYVEPPVYRNGYPRAPHAYGPNAYGINPYAQGMYAAPDPRYAAPGYPYARPYGRGYGAGYGLPLALGGGLLGGLLLTDLMF